MPVALICQPFRLRTNIPIILSSFGRYYGEIVSAIVDYLLLVAGTGLKEVSEVSGLNGLGLRAWGSGHRAWEGAGLEEVRHFLQA